MNIEFHYYMTYLVAARAGLGTEDAQILAYSSQYTDDNTVRFEVNEGKASSYRNYITQTVNILKPKRNLLRIYPIFHFIPGDPRSKSAFRNDGMMNWLNTTPNSKNANKILDAAIKADDLYRIGIASHAFADSWAHQNFVGYFSGFNSMGGPLDKAIPNVGHAEAGHNPDHPTLVWTDKRLIQKQKGADHTMDGRRVDNKERFLDAAETLLRKLMKYADPRVRKSRVDAEAIALRADLDQDMGRSVRRIPRSKDREKERIARSELRSLQPQYGEKKMPAYDSMAWFREAIEQHVRGLRDKPDRKLPRLDPFEDRYTWRTPRTRKQSHWFRFQEAVRAHQNEAWEIFKKGNLKGMTLPDW
jgi:hypothetical protein